MNKKFSLLLLVLVFIIAFSSSASSAPVPPAKGQWAYALESPLRLYEEADRDSDYREVNMPDKWISVPSAVRDDDNYLWYKVKIGNRTGWLPQNGIRLKMGGKSKTASNLYKKYYVKARQKIMKKPGDWEADTYEGTTSYTSDTGEFRVIRSKKGVEDVYFLSIDPDTCDEFFGKGLINVNQTKLRSKLGTPTMRETPYGDIDVNILSYELSDRNLTLSIRSSRSEGDKDGTTELIELYKGRAGENQN